VGWPLLAKSSLSLKDRRRPEADVGKITNAANALNIRIAGLPE
jgi:hypothetical protein